MEEDPVQVAAQEVAQLQREEAAVEVVVVEASGPE